MSGRHRIAAPPPLPDDLGLVLVDGDNLLHRVRGTRDEGALRWLLPRLRAWRPHDVRIVLMLDGHPEPGESFRRRVVSGIESHYSGDLDADTALVRLLAARPWDERARTVLITDDRALTDRARRVGGLVRRLDWLIDRLAAAPSAGAPVGPAPGGRAPGAASTRSGSAVAPGGGEHAERRPVTAPGRPTGVGAGRPPRDVVGMAGRGPARDGDGDVARRPWKPGRGATRKRGNPRRGHP